MRKLYRRPLSAREKLTGLSAESTVLVIGAGLTGVDVSTVLLLDEGHTDVRMISRTNVIPTVRVAPVEVAIRVLTMEAVDKTRTRTDSLFRFRGAPSRAAERSWH